MKMMNSAVIIMVSFCLLILAGACAGQARNPDDSDAQKNGSKSHENGTVEGKAEPEEVPVRGNNLPAQDRVPDEWPQSVPIIPGFEVENVAVNPMGGIHIGLAGSAGTKEVAKYYEEKLSGWERIEPEPFPPAFRDLAQFSAMKDGNTVDVVAMAFGKEGETRLTLWHNWRTPPGIIPDNWPEDIPILPGSEIIGCNIDQNGDFQLFLVGDMSLEDARDFYTLNLENWEKVGPKNLQDIINDQLVITFTKDRMRLNISGMKHEERTVIQLKTEKNSN